MRKNQYYGFAAAAAASIIAFTGCVKQNMTPTTQSQQAFSAPAATEESVLTPAGYMPRSRVHFIEKGFHINIEKGRYKKVEDKSGNVVTDFGIAKEANENLSVGKPNDIEPKPSGWVTYAYWGNDTTTGNSVTYFNTDWVVPKAPKTNNGQTIFLFNGMQDGFDANAHILQPVLQWGASAAGGGAYWSITNWYVGSTAFFGSLVNVSTGTVLQGIMQQTAQSGTKHSYTSSFAGYPSTDITVSNVRQLWWSAETLEVYGVTKNSDYPAAKSTNMTAVEIKKGAAEAAISWTPVKAFSQGPQHTDVVSNASPNGEVDLYYKKE